MSVKETTAPNMHDTVFMTLLANKDKKSDSNDIQKLGYLWHHHVENISGVRFKPSLYGPFSNRLAMAIDEMTALGFINENVTINASGENAYYELTKNGEETDEDVADNYKSEFNKIKDIISICYKEGDLEHDQMDGRYDNSFTKKIIKTHDMLLKDSDVNRWKRAYQQ
ncbi:hypothetical protein CENSYa_1025 [Cenarchaeum symbiosum A]|uniref:Uncharacterized protein n=1 Tax=Cenarchaeum symbiosum (strain A) TaxID=414004 RepID=A0RWE0_CENSY|nr:hypothetical protein CENSYa_1025 [Cenarchaeum symbiosum A]